MVNDPAAPCRVPAPAGTAASMPSSRILLSAVFVASIAGCADASSSASDASISCGALVCEPLGACDASTGTCRCDSGAWFDGRGCAVVEPCDGSGRECAPACPVPAGPVLQVVASSEELRFDSGGLPVEVAVTDDLASTAPTAWVAGDGVSLAPWAGRTVRVMARFATPACQNGPVYHAVFDVRGSYPGPPPSPESDAVAASDPSIVAWATRVAEVVAGPEVDPPFDDADAALGPATDSAFDVYSLGRGGTITLGFDTVVADGPGPDIAVFENGFTESFLEVAFVEVSSDGATFVRFDGASRTAEAVESYGTLDTRLLGQLAGKYPQGWGATFDLATLRQRPEVRAGWLDLGAVTHVRVVDIVGDGATLDGFGRPIFDPYPTVGSAGFDLDAVGVIRGADR